jgi:hypothetical protein
MPKAPSALYNHNVRLATACQLNISSGASGRTTLSFPSAQVQVEPPPAVDHQHDYYTVDLAMDIDEDHIPGDPDTPCSDSTIEVAPGVRVVTKPKAKRYINSVCFFFGT